MQLKQKLSYMAVGGALVLAGHVLPGLIVPKATAEFDTWTVLALGGVFVVAGLVVSGLIVQKAAAKGEAKPSAEYDTLTVRSLNVVDALGRIRARIEATKPPDVAPVEEYEELIQVFSEAGVSVYRVGVLPTGGIVGVLGNDGKTRASMGVSSEGGNVHVSGNDGRARASMGVSPKGGRVSVYGNDGKTCAGMGVLPDGGEVSVYGNDEYPRAEMAARSEGGFMSTYDRRSRKTGELP